MRVGVFFGSKLPLFEIYLAIILIPKLFIISVLIWSPFKKVAILSQKKSNFDCRNPGVKLDKLASPGVLNFSPDFWGFLSLTNFMVFRFDQLLNLVIDSTSEQLRDMESPFGPPTETRQLGLVVCRGTSVVLISPQDGMEEIPNPFIQQ